MNRHGVILKDVGMSDFADDLVAQVIVPIASVVFADVGGELKFPRSQVSLRRRLGIFL